MDAMGRVPGKTNIPFFCQSALNKQCQTGTVCRSTPSAICKNPSIIREMKRRKAVAEQRLPGGAGGERTALLVMLCERRQKEWEYV